MFRARLAHALVLISLLSVASPSRAQITSSTGSGATPTEGVGHDYIKMLNESVNPANGAVSIRIQLPTPPGRRLSLPFSFNYDSNATYTPQGLGNGGAGYMEPTQQYLLQGGWSYGLPVGSNMQVSQTQTGFPTCYATTAYMFQDSAGTRYSFGRMIGFESGPRVCVGEHSTTGDSSDFYSASITGYGSPMTVSSQDGTTYTFNVGAADGCFGSSDWPGSTLPSTIEDRNGNIITISGPPTVCTGSFTATDTLGRTVLSSSGFGKTGNTIAIPGLSPYTLTWGSVSPNYSPGSTWDNPGDPACSSAFAGPGGAPIPVITAITLPNGQHYTLTYDPTYGLLTKITYPNGGYISYAWGLNSRSDFVAVQDDNGAPQQCLYTYDTPALTHRYVSFDGATIAEQQDFTNYSTTWSPSSVSTWTAKAVTVTTHDLVNGTSFQTNYAYSPATVPSGSPWLPTHFGTQVPVEQTIVYHGTNGNTLRTVNKTWNDQFEIKTDQTVLDNNQTSQVNFTWNGGLVTEKDEYDFGLTLLKKTTYAYWAGLNLPCQTIVYDGNNNRFAETDSYFDGSSTLCALGTPSVAAVTNLPPGTHDETNHGPTSTTPRGNVTTIKKLCFSGCTNPVTTSFTYDETGQLLTSQDPNGNVTHYSYADSYTVLSGGSNTIYTSSYNTNALLTQTSDPLGHTQVFTHDFNNGQLTSSKDQNSLATTYVYNDSLARPTLVIRPDGGQSIISYNDISHIVTTSKEINPTQTITTTALSDGVGHVKQTQLISDPQGTVYTDTTYDGLGKVRTVSNPYRTGNDPTTTTGTTTYFYDALGRKCLEVPPDGTLPTGNVCPSTQPANDLFTVYSGSTTTVSDQTGRSRASVLDGLGRLMKVLEDPSGLNYETDYVYDPLNDLLSVNQKGGSANSSLWRTRTFTYDSLSRLLTSINPEVGTITYKYDSDTNCPSPNSFIGLLVSKTDARGIRTCVQYDITNREVVINYSNGDPTITTTYDQTNCLGLGACQNIGYRTSVTDAAGFEAWSYQVDATNHRSVHVDQRTTTSGSNHITKTATYYLDLSGNVTQAVYPTGRIINYTYNNANRPMTAADGSNGITYATDFQTAPSGCLASAVCYTPQGSFYALSIGQSSSFAGLNLTHTYNSRLQPNEFKASSSAGSAIDISYSYADPLNGNHNAGHVFSIINNLNSSRTQAFTHDSLNRITSAGTTATSGAYCWGYLYSYDAWANLLSQAGWSPNYNGCSEATMGSVAADGNNHISGFAYDASGNTQNDGTIAYTFDGESQMKTANGVTYAYDGDGRRVYKSNGKLYWYGAGGDILAETDAFGNTENEYVFFGGKRIAVLPGNAISNGGFEQGLQGWSTFGTGINAQLIASTSTCHSGSNCLELTNSSGGDPGIIDSQQIPLVVGESFNWGGWVNHIAGANSYARWEVAVYSQNGNVYLQAANNSIFGSWVYQSGSYTVPSFMLCPCHAQIYIDFASASELNEAYFDDGAITFGSSSGGPLYYVEDMLGTSRLITTNNGTVCYDADFDPFGGEHPYTNTCPQNYKFEGKERDTETGNDDFGARSYSSRFGRWLSADWSNVPAPVPYANPTNPQTLNLYSMVSDDPESFADLDGHTSAQMYQLATPGAGSAWDPMGASSMTDDSGLTLEEFNALEAARAAQSAQQQAQNTTAFNPTVTYDKNLSAKDVAADQSKVGGAVGVINSNWSKLSDQEKATVGNIKSIDVSGSAQRSYVQESTGKLTLTQDYVSKSSKAWLASAIGHDGEHVALFNAGGIGASRGLPAEVKAMQFQLQVGTKFGLSATETKYLQGLIQNPSQLQQYINTPP